MGSNGNFLDNEEAPTYAPSIPVPNVQELVRKDPLQVPQRYVREVEDRPKDTDTSYLSSVIPVIDLSLLFMGNNEELTKLDLACLEWGFFQVVNHGVAKQVSQKMKDAAAEFFELSLEEKNKYAMPSDDIQGYGHAYVVSEDQILDWSDALILLVHPSHYRKLKFWPNSPKGLQEIIEEYSNAIRKVATELFQSFSLIMEMDKEALLGLHKQLVQAYRIKHNNEWVPVNPIPDALVVNVGDVFEIWSNGKYKSVEHRAVANYNKARISYASFMFPHDEVEIGPLSHMVDSKTKQQLFKKVRYGEYLRSSMNKKMEGKAHTQMAKIEG
ncbi:hypothetical protein V6Z11_D04G147000 [Gossypium hirsutum]|uniref:S-norcoclaurine synthase 1 isoform X2 n=1 Tax=Gossypium hirsutum TaxID=3635 RepID=A0A1U8IQV6_GOSHI|nr:S-norcoclaurine synthase 1 isoform X2 [Gossypium hirsutum]